MDDDRFIELLKVFLKKHKFEIERFYVDVKRDMAGSAKLFEVELKVKQD